MDTFWTLLEQIGLFVIYIIVGVILVKTKVLSRDTLETLSRYVLKLAMPVMIFVNTVNGVDRQSLIETSPLLGITVLFYCCTFLLAKGLAMVFWLRDNKEQVYRALSMFGNIGFMGIPIISSIFPERGMLYIAVFTIIDQLVLWTLGVKLTTPSGGKGTFTPKKLVNPCTVAVGGICGSGRQDALPFEHRFGQNRRDCHPSGHDLSGRRVCLYGHPQVHSF